MRLFSRRQGRRVHEVTLGFIKGTVRSFYKVIKASDSCSEVSVAFQKVYEHSVVTVLCCCCLCLEPKKADA